MRYDFHVHTSHHSPCALSSPEEICRKAVKLGLSGIALTEHDLWWPSEELDLLRRKYPSLVLFRGAEFTFAEGHFLIFLPDSPTLQPPEPFSYELQQMVTHVHELGGIVVWAHPFRFDRGMADWLDSVEIDGLETASSNMNDQMGATAWQLAVSKSIMSFQNSDTHHIDTLGKFFNVFPGRLNNTDDFVNYVRGRSL